MPAKPRILTVALPTPLHQHFEYLAPANQGPASHTQDPNSQTAEGIDHCEIRIGCRVLVNFGKQELVGIITGVSEQASYPLEKLKQAQAILDTEPILSGDVLAICQFAADYYQHSLGETLIGALPQKLRESDGALPTQQVWQLTREGKGLNEKNLKRSPQQQAAWQALYTHGSISANHLEGYNISKTALVALEKKGLVERIETRKQTTQTASSHKAPQQVLAESPRKANLEQEVVLRDIHFHRFGCHLLEGVTGSGKTEVYLQAIARVLQAGQQALVLVPEIGLTPQTMARFRQRFAVPIVELHSNVAKGARLENWHAAQTGEARVIIGTRLAVFAPAPKLGIIIVDEEHDLSFKQQDGLRYHARDLAIMRAKHCKIPIILGSATPSLESLQQALSGRYRHLQLRNRAGEATAPDLQLLDMRREVVHAGIAQSSLEAIGAALARGEQALVFVNRRGFAPALLCQSCGWSAACKRCDARMTLHNQPRKLHCHHCGAQQYPPNNCPSCLNPELTPVGQGTERAEDMLQATFAGYPVYRVDQDSMQRKRAMDELRENINTGKPCILVGTQMLAKGHHFKNMTLVVVVDADQGLFSGDFRGVERMGQQIVQVAGRAGRADKKGTVIIQSYKPDHPYLTILTHQNYREFAEQLLQERFHSGMPPHEYLALIRAESKRPENAKQLLAMAATIAQKLQPANPQCGYLGPIPALMEKREDRYRYQWQLKCKNRQQRNQFIKLIREELQTTALAKRVRWSIDIDPMDMG